MLEKLETETLSPLSDAPPSPPIAKFAAMPDWENSLEPAPLRPPAIDIPASPPPPPILDASIP